MLNRYKPVSLEEITLGNSLSDVSFLMVVRSPFLPNRLQMLGKSCRSSGRETISDLLQTLCNENDQHDA